MAIAYRSMNSANAVGATSVAVTKPSGLATGDLLFCVVYLALSGYDNEVVAPSGFTYLASARSGECTSKMFLFYKVISDASTEPASYTVSVLRNRGLTYGFGAFLFAYSGVGIGAPIVDVDTHADDWAGQYVHIDDVHIARGGASMVFVGAYRTSAVGWSTPFGFTENYDGATGNFRLAASMKTYASGCHSGCFEARSSLRTDKRRSIHVSARVTNMPPTAPRLLAPIGDAFLGPELLVNTTMEADLTWPASGWESNAAFGIFEPATISRSGTQHHGGSYSMRAAWPTASKPSVINSWMQHPATPGAVYRLSGWVYVPTGSPSLKATCIWSGVSPVTIATKDAWVYSTWDVVAQSGSLWPGWETATNPTSGQYAYIDDVSFRRVLNSDGMLDRTTTQRFTWTFTDPDPKDRQSKFDLRYKLVSATSWTTVTRQVPYSYHDFAANTFSAGDYEWQVRCYDQGGAVGPYSDSSYFSVADPPTAPTIDSPTDGGTVTHTHEVTWTVDQQTSYQVRTVADDAGSPDTSIVYQDTDEVVNSSQRAQVIGFEENNRYEHVQVRIRYNGIWSSWHSHRVQVSYTPPPVPTFTLTAVDASGALDIAITNPAPGGGEPAVVGNEIWVDEGVGMELRKTGQPPSTTFRYYTAVSGFDYSPVTVAVRALGSDGTQRWSSSS